MSLPKTAVYLDRHLGFPNSAFPNCPMWNGWGLPVQPLSRTGFVQQGAADPVGRPQGVGCMPGGRGPNLINSVEIACKFVASEFVRHAFC